MSDGGPRIVRAVRREQVFEGVDAAALDDLERRTIAFLYAIWGMQGVKKRIVRVESNGHNPQLDENHETMID